MEMSLLFNDFFFLTEQLRRFELLLTDIANIGTSVVKGGQEFSFQQVTFKVLIRYKSGDVQLATGF